MTVPRQLDIGHIQETPQGRDGHRQGMLDRCPIAFAPSRLRERLILGKLGLGRTGCICKQRLPSLKLPREPMHGLLLDKLFGHVLIGYRYIATNPEPTGKPLLLCVAAASARDLKAEDAGEDLVAELMDDAIRHRVGAGSQLLLVCERRKLLGRNFRVGCQHVLQDLLPDLHHPGFIVELDGQEILFIHGFLLEESVPNLFGSGTWIKSSITDTLEILTPHDPVVGRPEPPGLWVHHAWILLGLVVTLPGFLAGPVASDPLRCSLSFRKPT